MEKKDWRTKIGSILNNNRVDILDKDGSELLNDLEELFNQELDKAREEGYQDCLDDIWEEAKGLRGWAEHDGNVSATDIEAGLQEAYLNIENKLKDNK